MVLQAYVDGSGTGDPRFLILAGYIASDDVWAAFSEAWQSRLNDAQIPFFKMNQMANKQEIAGWFYRTIEEFNIKASIACIVNTAELVEVQNNIVYPSYITNPNKADNPYYWCFRYITVLLAQRQKELNLLEPVDFIFDDESEKVKIPRAWEIIKRVPNLADITNLMGDMPRFCDDKRTMPLQAADLYAWWVLKWMRDGVEDWATNLPFPWEIKKNIPRLAAYFGKRSFLYEISTNLEKLARTPEELKYARSLMPEEWQESSKIPSRF